MLADLNHNRGPPTTRAASHVVDGRLARTQRCLVSSSGRPNRPKDARPAEDDA